MARPAFRPRLIAILLGLGLSMAQPFCAVAGPDEDWAQAVQLMRADRPQAALPFLEGLVAAQPANKDYRFELALALFRLKKDFRAKWHLDQVRGAKLTDAEARLVEHYLDRIEARRKWSGYFGLRLRPESNVGKQTSNGSVNIGGLNFTLNNAARGRPGTSVIATGGLGWQRPIAPRTRVQLSLDSYLRHNRDRSLRDYQVAGRAGLGFAPDPRHLVEGGLVLGHRWIADRAYSHSTGVFARHSMLVGQAGRLDLGTELTDTDYRNGIPGSQRYALQASYSHAISGNAQITLSGFLEQTHSRQRTQAGQRYGAALSGLYMFRGGLITGLRLGWQDDRRDGPEPVFGVARHDRNTTLDLSFYHQKFRIGNFAPELLIGIERNSSNISLADYDNRYLSVGLTRNF